MTVFERLDSASFLNKKIKQIQQGVWTVRQKMQVIKKNTLFYKYSTKTINSRWIHKEKEQNF